MNAPTNLPAEQRRPAPIEVLKGQTARKADEFKMVLPAHISVEKFQRTIATAALANPKLLECDRQSLLMAAMKLAQDGLLPDGREAALVPFKTRVKTGSGKNDWGDSWQVQAMPMVYGLRKKVLQSGGVISLEVGVVYRREVEEGHFIHEVGMEPPIRHRPMLDLTEEDVSDDKIVAAYSIARLKNDAGGEPFISAEVLRRFEINKIREMSQTGSLKDRYGKPRTPSGPWVDWFSEQAKKSALRRHSKVLPMSGDVLDTLNREDEELHARGAGAMLDAPSQAPVALPTVEDDLDGDEIPAFDKQTGEVIDQAEAAPATGMTETDEQTARQLDAGEGEQAGQPEDDRSPADIFRDKILADLPKAKILAAVEKIDAEWLKNRAAYDDAEAVVIDQKINARRNALRGAEGNA